MDRLLTVAEVAKILGVGYRRAAYLCEKGEFGTLRSGRRWLIRESELMDYHSRLTNSLPLETTWGKRTRLRVPADLTGETSSE